MRRRALAVEKPGIGDDPRALANRYQGRPLRRLSLQPRDQDLVLGVQLCRHDDNVSALGSLSIELSEGRVRADPDRTEKLDSAAVTRQRTHVEQPRFREDAVRTMKSVTSAPACPAATATRGRV
jgi:hypothetical protein